MGIYKRKGSDNWYYEFQYKGQTFKGSTGTANKVEAQRFELTMRDRAKEASELQSRGLRELTLGEAVDKWMEWSLVNRSSAHKDASRARKVFGLELREGVPTKVRWGLEPSRKLQSLCQADLMEIVDRRQEEGNSNGTINRELSLWQSVLTWAKPRNIMTPAPGALDFSLAKLEEAQGKLRYLTMEEEGRLLDHLKGKRERTESVLSWDQYDLVVLWLDTGCRYTEGTSLTWDVIDLERGTINLYRPKVRNESTIAITARLRGVLERRKEATKGRRHVFPAGSGRGWDAEDKPRAYSPHSIREAMDAVGLNEEHLVHRFGRATIHTFRDTFASRLVQAGASLYEVQVLLGHTNPAMTQKYAKLQVRDVSLKAVGLLDQVHQATRLNVPITDNPMALTG